MKTKNTEPQGGGERSHQPARKFGSLGQNQLAEHYKTTESENQDTLQKVRVTVTEIRIRNHAALHTYGYAMMKWPGGGRVLFQ